MMGAFSSFMPWLRSKFVADRRTQAEREIENMRHRRRLRKQLRKLQRKGAR